MTPKLVISDVDGTLVRHDKSLSEANIAAVARLQAAGLPFTLISARPPSGIAPLIRTLGIVQPAGAFNGGTIVGADGGIVERRCLPADVVAGSFAIAEGTGAQPWLFASGRWHLRTLDNPHVGRERIAADQEPVVLDDLSPLFGDVDKLTWVSDDHDLLARLDAEMAARFAGRAEVARSQPYYLDLTTAGANKGEGIAAIARLAGVDLAEVAVLGDMPNDLPMFARAGLAIAMGQAPEEVRAAARFTSTSNDEDGVAHAIDAILLPMIERRP